MWPKVWFSYFQSYDFFIPCFFRYFLVCLSFYPSVSVATFPLVSVTVFSFHVTPRALRYRKRCTQTYRYVWELGTMCVQLYTPLRKQTDLQTGGESHNCHWRNTILWLAVNKPTAWDSAQKSLSIPALFSRQWGAISGVVQWSVR